MPVLRANTQKLGYFGITEQGLCAASPRKPGGNGFTTKSCPPCLGPGATTAYCDSVVKNPDRNYQLYITVVTETQGTKEDLPCSGRGICDVETSICTCTFGYTISNGFGALPAVGDRNMANCGYSDPTLVKFDCPGEIGCSGHGMCSGAPTSRL